MCFLYLLINLNAQQSCRYHERDENKKAPSGCLLV